MEPDPRLIILRSTSPEAVLEFREELNKIPSGVPILVWCNIQFTNEFVDAVAKEVVEYGGPGSYAWSRTQFIGPYGGRFFSAAEYFMWKMTGEIE